MATTALSPAYVHVPSLSWSAVRMVVRWVSQVVAWMVILASLGVLVLCVVVPRVTGATPYTVLTSSMTPTYPPGTLVVIKPASVEDIGIGTVVTYQLSSGKAAVVTHRVVATRVSTHNSEVEFQTKGDANNTADAEWVRPMQIRGRLWYAVPKLGFVSELLTGTQRSQAVNLVAYGLFGYAGASIVLALIQPRRPVRTTRRVGT